MKRLWLWICAAILLAVVFAAAVDEPIVDGGPNAPAGAVRAAP